MMKLFQVMKKSEGRFWLAGIFTDPDAAEAFVEARSLIDDSRYETRVVEADEPCDGYEQEYAAMSDSVKFEIALYCIQGSLQDALLTLKLAKRCECIRTSVARCPS